MPDFLIWPAVALVLGFVAMLLFKPAIDKKIGGITHASKDSFSFERPQEGGEPQSSLLPFVQLMKEPISPSALAREQPINNQLQSFGLQTDSEKISVLIRVLANTRIELEFNNIAHTIFGSQVALLINIAGTTYGVTHQNAEAVFAQAVKSYPELHENKTMQNWLAYLSNSNLISIDGDRIDITQYGKDFLKHLVDTRQAHQRYG